MRKIWLFGMLWLFLMTSPAFGQQQRFGVGVIIGEPTGLSLKSWLSTSQALDLAAAWSFEEYESLQFQVDYLFHTSRLLQERQLGGYYGIGGRFKVKEQDTSDAQDGHIGIRFPIGLTYLFQTHPLDLFLEFAPILDLVPETAFTINAGFGMRIYF